MTILTTFVIFCERCPFALVTCECGFQCQQRNLKSHTDTETCKHNRELKSFTKKLESLEIEIKNLRKELEPYRSAYCNYQDYHYNRFTVIALSQLVAHYITHDDHGNIDRNSIFTCIHKIVDDWRAGYDDSSPYMHLDVRMLLSTALAARWFTDKQRDKLQYWLEQTPDE